jgi:hypothetical protein
LRPTAAVGAPVRSNFFVLADGVRPNRLLRIKGTITATRIDIDTDTFEALP